MHNDNDLLVRHPAPFASEALPGYVLRLAEANGYDNIGKLLRFSGFEGGGSGWMNIDLGKLANATGMPISVFRPFSLKPLDNRPHRWSVNGNLVIRRDVTLTKARICPICVSEMGYIEATWLLDIFIGCPRHSITANWFCNSCKRPLVWRRKGLLTCRCGAPIVPSSRNRFLSPEEIAILNLIRFKITGFRVDQPSGEDLCDSSLVESNLDDLLSLMRCVTNARSGFRRGTESLNPPEILKGGGEVLSKWPENFLLLLKKLSPRPRIGSEWQPPQHVKEAFDLYLEACDLRFNRLIKNADIRNAAGDPENRSINIPL